MKVKEAIMIADSMKPNQYEFSTKVKWLSNLDGMIYQEIFMTHDGNIRVPPHYTVENAEDAELLVPYPYAEDVYNYFLQSQIDKENGEIAKYNQSVSMYNNAFKTFQDWYNRTHRPLPRHAAFRF